MSTVIAEGSPLFPHAGRFASIIERNQVTLFKAGSTFLKAVMTDPASTQEMSRYDMSTLKVGTFCAEPVSPAVQKFAMENICSHYINSTGPPSTAASCSPAHGVTSSRWKQTPRPGHCPGFRRRCALLKKRATRVASASGEKLKPVRKASWSLPTLPLSGKNTVGRG